MKCLKNIFDERGNNRLVSNRRAKVSLDLNFWCKCLKSKGELNSIVDRITLQTRFFEQIKRINIDEEGCCVVVILIIQF